MRTKAKLHYLPGNYKILSHGDYVLCAVTGVEIPLTRLCYWSAEKQEAYAGPDIALKRFHQFQSEDPPCANQ